MAIHPRNTRRCNGWEPKNMRCCRVNETYLHEPPVRDTNTGTTAYYEPRVVTTVPSRPLPEGHAEPGVYYTDRVPNAPPIGSPPMGRYDLFDLRFDTRYQRWYWVPNSVPNQTPFQAMQAPVQAIRQPMAVPQPYCCAPSTCYPSSCCDTFCRWLCGSPTRRPVPPAQQALQSSSYIQSMYRTPSGSDLLVSYPAGVGPGQRAGPPPPPPLTGQPYAMSRATEPCRRGEGEGPDSCHSKRKRCKGGHTRHEEHSASTSSSGNECPCAAASRRRPRSLCCPCYAAPTCCPCQNACTQNICCTCAQSLQRNVVQQQQQQQSVQRPVKKKAKCSRCCCTQTATQSKDKAVLTKMVEVSDACVCCKPKKQQRAARPAPRNTCIICRRPNSCPARCCPCMLPLCLGNAGCAQHSGPPGIEAGEDSDVKCNVIDCSEGTRYEADDSCGPCCYDTGEATGCDDNTCGNKNFTVNRLKATTGNNYPATSNMSWINDMLLKKSLPTMKQKYFQNDNKFSSPLTGNTYNVNMVKIKNRHYRNYTALDPLSADETIDELRKAVENVKYDPEHRNLVTAVCEALLNNRTKSSFEGGDSSFMEEYTYANQSDAPLVDPNACLRPNVTGVTFGGAFRSDLANNISSVAQTSFSHFRPVPTVNAETITVQPDLINRQLITDPINPLFNEMTQTGVDELFEEYMKKIRHAKLFSGISLGVQSEDAKVPAATHCRVTDLGLLKDAPSQYDKPENIVFNNENDRGRERFKTTIPIYKPKSSEAGKTQRGSDMKPEASMSTENENQSETDSVAEQDNTVSARKLAGSENHQNSGSDNAVTSSKNAVTKPKRKRSATPSENAANTTREDREQSEKPGDRHRLCINSEDSVTKLSIHCPRNRKADNQHTSKSLAVIPKNKSATQVKSATQIKSTTQIKSATMLQDTSSGKKRKMINKQLQEITDVDKSMQNDKSQNILRFQTRIPIICPDKFRSSNECATSEVIKSSEVLKQIETTISSLSFAGVKSDPEQTQDVSQTRIPELEDLYISNQARDHTFDYGNEAKRKEHFNPVVHYNVVNTYSEYDDESHRDGLKYSNETRRNSKDDRNHLTSCISNNEILISNVSYDSEGSLENSDDLEPLDDFSVNSATENQKSALSIIKEETESDVNVNAVSSAKYMDINTSPFNFEISHHSFVDTCSSPFEMKKQKERRHSGLLCFSSHEESAEPYKAASGGSSTAEEVERPRTARGIRWLFNM